MKSDIEISNECKILSIDKIASSIGLSLNDIEMYGRDKAKIDFLNVNKTSNNSKLILVTSINPTISGEGKTTISIGLCDALNQLGKTCIATLREPSLGPVMGRKGGACGGGYSQVVPMDSINLHFTGDMHAITTCNNLLASVIDNHIFYGNELLIDPSRIVFHRCLDLNDRFLRDVDLSVGDLKLHEKFDITAASEIMAIFCLATDYSDLRDRLNKIIVAYNKFGNPVYVSDLSCVGSLMAVLRDAFKPNLVQTLEHNPVFVHGGPFANIAHGCCSLISTKLAMNLSDYVVTEAGFGADLGAEKFFDIKCRYGNLKPSVIVINVTVKSLLSNGNGDLLKGVEFLSVHVENMRKFIDNVIVVLNKFSCDSNDDIRFLIGNVTFVPFVICDSYVCGGKGALDLAKKVIELSNKNVEFNYLYDLDVPVCSKIEKICKEIYRAETVEYSDEAIKKISSLSKEFLALPICIAKTPYSLSGDSKLVGSVGGYSIYVNDIKVNNGAGFIVVYLSNILTMPGLIKDANLYKIDLLDNGKVVGID